MQGDSKNGFLPGFQIRFSVSTKLLFFLHAITFHQQICFSFNFSIKRIKYGNKPKDKIVIVGGGFVGMVPVKELKNQPVSVTLIDKQNYHSFQPLFYQVASARLEPASISFPFRKSISELQEF